MGSLRTRYYLITSVVFITQCLFFECSTLRKYILKQNKTFLLTINGAGYGHNYRRGEWNLNVNRRGDYSILG